MRPARLVMKTIYNVYAMLLFIALMFCVFPFAAIGSLFGKIKGGNFIYRLCMRWADSWWFLIGIRHKNIYEYPHDKNKQYIFVANHISYIDSPVIVKAIRQPVRVLGKSEISRIPFFGFIYRKAIITVDRSSAESRAKSVRILKSILKRRISIFMFPEGSFNQTHEPLKSFYDGAFRMAIETQTPIKPLLFLDSYDRMPYEYFFSLTPGRSRAVFLEEVSVEGLTIHQTQELKKRVYDIMEEKLIAYNASWIRK